LNGDQVVSKAELEFSESRGRAVLRAVGAFVVHSKVVGSLGVGMSEEDFGERRFD